MAGSNIKLEPDKLLPPALTRVNQKVSVFFALALAGSIFLLPFALYGIYQGRIIHGGSIATIALLFLINARYIYKQHKPLIPPNLLPLPLIAILGYTVDTMGIVGVLWSFPALILFFFSLNRIPAIVYSIILTAAVSIIFHFQTTPELSIRVFATLAAVVAFSTITSTLISELQDYLYLQSISEPLTQAYNTEHFMHNMDDALERKLRHDTPCSLVCIDIDNFKRINEMYGRARGNDALVMLVEKLSIRLRRLDKIFRIGGEDFAIILPDTKLRDAVIVSEDIRQLAEDEFHILDEKLTISVGIAELEKDESADDWLKRAHHALAGAKKKGGNHVTASAKKTVPEGEFPSVDDHYEFTLS